MVQNYKKLKVLGVLGDLAACGWYRLEFPFEALRRLGVDALTTFDPTVELIFNSDVTILQRMFDPSFYNLIQEMRSDAGAKRTIIYEIDDYLHGVHPLSPAYKTFQPGSPVLTQFNNYMKNSDGLFTSTKELYSRYGSMSGKAWVIPNCIDFGIREWYQKPKRHPHLQDKLVIGWAGSSFHPDDILPFKTAIKKVLELRKDSIFAICSGPEQVSNFLRILDLPRDRYAVLNPVPFWFYPGLISQFDIGLAPLTSNQFNLCKCVDAKTLVCTSAGIKPISDIRSGDCLADYKNNQTTVVAVEKQAPVEGLCITTENGYSISVTKEHRLLTYYDEYGEFNTEWTVAADITTNDNIYVSPTQFSTGLIYLRSNFLLADPKLPVVIEHGDSNNYSLNTPYIRVTKELMSVVGLLRASVLSSGSEIKISKSSFRLCIIRDFLVSLGFNILTAIEDNCKVDDKIIRITNPIINQILTYVLDKDDILLCSSKHVIKSFIATYFSENGILRDKSITVFGDSHNLKLIHLLLLGINVIAKLTNDSLIIDVPNTSKFIMAVDPTRNLVWRNRREYRTIIRSFYRSVPCYQMKERVASINPITIEPIDIQTSTGTFLANGIVSHNSNLKILEYGAWGIPYVASLIAPYARFASETDNQGGVLLKTGGQEKFIRMALDDDYRKACGDYIKDYVHTNYNLTVTGNIMLQSILEAIELKSVNKSMPIDNSGCRNSPGRNTPCPCDSGKKYKSCCYPAWN